MRKVIYQCDRCEKQFKYDYKERDNRNLVLVDYNDESYDICPRCQKELEKWWDEVRGESEK
jgi:DNA-directed RNA polymerase subunit RPC12/RpoP